MKWYIIILLILGGLFLCFLLYIFFLWLCSRFIDTTREYDTDSGFFRTLLVGATRILILLCRISVSVHGMERIPKGRFLMVANHRSKFDPMISWVVFKKTPIAFISKKENFDIPIFGRMIRKCAFMSIDRENPREALHTIEKAAGLLREDVVSVGVYPEGTRSNTREMLPYRNGCLKIAKMAEVPIVVVAITGTQKIHKQSPWKRTKVAFSVVDVISREDVNAAKTKELGERIFEHINDVLIAEEYE